MSHELPADLIRQIESYLNDQSSSRIVNGENLEASKRFLLLEHLLDRTRENARVKSRYNVSLYTDSTIRSFDYFAPNHFHRPVDYQYPYLFWLFRNYKAGGQLVYLVDSFFDEVKDKLFYTDLLLTKTGVTRCKTNLRLCTTVLRKYGILQRTDNEKRAFGFTIFGLMVMYQLQFDLKGDPYSSLDEPLRSHEVKLDPRIYRAYHVMNGKEGFDSLMRNISNLNLTLEEHKALVKYKDGYLALFFDYVDVNGIGVKQIKSDSAILAEYVDKAEQGKEFKLLRTKLQQHFAQRDK